MDISQGKPGTTKIGSMSTEELAAYISESTMIGCDYAEYLIEKWKTSGISDNFAILELIQFCINMDDRLVEAAEAINKENGDYKLIVY